MRLSADRVLDLHRQIVGIRSVSGEEAALADFLTDWLGHFEVPVSRIGQSLLATLGEGPVLLLDTHLDTVPPATGWSRDPWTASVEEGRVYGLGSNDAKAALAAMVAAFVAFREADLPFTLALALVEQEETRGLGTEAVLAELERRGQRPQAAVVGEPTGLDLAVAQKGLMVLELVARGRACHAAHAASLGGTSAIRQLARDLVALDGLDLGPPHPQLGGMTLEPTVLAAGAARNAVPGEAKAILDLRTTPVLSPAEIAARVAARVGSEVRVLSDRLRPCAIDEASLLLAAARQAAPAARLYGSPTLSDMALLGGIPAIKVGPGRSERSHTADEYVLESEVLAAVPFYTALVRAYATGREAAAA